MPGFAMFIGVLAEITKPGDRSTNYHWFLGIELPYMMIVVFISKNADFLFGHLSEKVMYKLIVREILVSQYLRDPDRSLNITISFFFQYRKRFSSGHIFADRLVVLRIAFERPFAKKLS
jgi:hypothetical protein